MVGMFRMVMIIVIVIVHFHYFSLFHLILTQINEHHIKTFFFLNLTDGTTDQIIARIKSNNVLNVNIQYMQFIDSVNHIIYHSILHVLARRKKTTKTHHRINAIH